MLESAEPATRHSLHRQRQTMTLESPTVNDGAVRCSDGLERKIQIASGRIRRAIDETKPVAVFGLFSGGHDSVTATALAVRLGAYAIHINTGIGVARTREYVWRIADLLDWPSLQEYRAEDNRDAKGNPISYRNLILKHGFPGPASHSLMYAMLKEECLRRLEKDWQANGRGKNPRRVLFVSGCRSGESKRRMGSTKELVVSGKRVWCSPIHDWTKDDTSEFMRASGIPRNPVVDMLCKSGECLCGAFAEPGELEELNCWPETREVYQQIKALEAEAKAANVPCRWGERPPAWWEEKQKGQKFLCNYDEHLCWSCTSRREALHSNDRTERSAGNAGRSQPEESNGI